MPASFTKTCLLLLFTCIAAVAAAHTGSVKGIVYDDATHKPLEGVSIFIKTTNSSATTDAFGKYFIKGIPQGTYTVTLSYLGYQTLETKISVEDGVTTELTQQLQPSSVTMNAVTINAKKEEQYSTISGLDLKLRPVNTSQDLVRMVPGLFTSQHQGGGKAEQMFLRGFDVDHGTDVNVCVDGMPVNMVSHAHGQGYADLHFLIPELVDKMSFGKGPYRIDKGDFATAGWVDFKTKDYLDNSFIKLESGMYGYFRTVGAINLLNKQSDNSNQSAYIAGEYGYNRGYFDQPQNFNRMNLVGKYTNMLSKDKMLSITASGFRSNWDASGQIPERAVAEGLINRFGELDAESGKTSRYNLNLQYAQAINNHSHFKSNVFASYYDFELYSNFTFYLKDTVNGDQIRQKEQRMLGGYNASYDNTYYIGKLHTKTEAGIGLRYDNVMGDELSHTLNKDITLERLAYGDVNETNINAYVNQVFYLAPQLVLNAGTRFDYFIHTYDDHLATEKSRNTYYTHTFSPKLGLYYNFADNGRVYFNYGTGFHTNDTRVVVAQQAKTILPRAFSYDLGTVVKPYKKLLLSAAVWMLDLQQEFVYVGDEGVVEPSGRTRRTGFDLSMRYELLKWLYLDGDFTYTKARARDEATGQDYIPLAPKTTAIGGATVRINDHFSTSLRFRHMGDRPANEDNSVIAKGYTVMDLVANYVRPKYEFGLQVQNLTNTTWNEAQFDTESRLRNEVMPVSEIHFTPGTPFFLKLSATYKF